MRKARLRSAAGTSFHRFETREEAEREDRKRARLIQKTIQHYRAANSDPVVPLTHKLRRLSRRLGTVREGRIPATPASARKMRRVRKQVFAAVMAAFEVFDDREICTFTVISTAWRFDSDQLESVTARQIKRRFLSHLDRSDISPIKGCLVAFIHGEFDPSSGLFQLHLHGVGTRAKVKALHRLKGRWGYKKTTTGSHPIRIEAVRNRGRQVSYLLQGFWPSRAVRDVAGVQKRDRRKGRIPEPFHAQSLCWLDRQKLGEMTIAQGCRFLPNGQLRLRALVVDDAGGDS
jgi:hypothetical protein